MLLAITGALKAETDYYNLRFSNSCQIRNLLQAGSIQPEVVSALRNIQSGLENDIREDSRTFYDTYSKSLQSIIRMQ